MKLKVTSNQMFVMWIKIKKKFTVSVKDDICKRHFVISNNWYSFNISLYFNLLFLMVFVNFIVGTGIFPSVCNGSSSCKITSWQQIKLDIRILSYHYSLFERKVYSSDLFKIENMIFFRISFSVLLSIILIKLNELYKLS